MNFQIMKDYIYEKGHRVGRSWIKSKTRERKAFGELAKHKPQGVEEKLSYEAEQEEVPHFGYADSISATYTTT